MASYYTTLENDRYYDMMKALQQYRLSDFIRAQEAISGNSGLIFPFSRGLRLSAQLIYAIREMISDRSDLEVHWGQIIHTDGQSCSGECDIVIHRKGHFRRWNGRDGDGSHVMDFRFIKGDQALAVISCKSYLVKSKLEKKYAARMNTYVPELWLFAECCGPRSANRIRAAAKDVGYSKFWRLYDWGRRTGEVVDALDDWDDFAKTIAKLKTDNPA